MLETLERWRQEAGRSVRAVQAASESSLRWFGPGREYLGGDGPWGSTWSIGKEHVSTWHRIFF